VTEHKITTYGPEHFGGVKALWQEAFPGFGEQPPSTHHPHSNKKELAPHKLDKTNDPKFYSLGQNKSLSTVTDIILNS
jgi:hypothetical protein